MRIPWIDEVQQLSGAVVLVRAGLNIPLQHGTVVNDFRIRKALPTLRFLKEQGARVIVLAHVGRDPEASLRTVAHELSAHIPVQFQTRDTLDVSAIARGDIVVLENLRRDPREVANDESLAVELAQRADMFVQDAFAACHREHASIVGIPHHLPSYGGLLLRAEITALNRARDPRHPALAILGGAKFETKEPLIRTFLDTYDSVFVGGALQNEILAARGLEVGDSRVADGSVPADILHHPALARVSDVVVEYTDGQSKTVAVDVIAPGDVIVDIGPASVAKLVAELPRYQTVLWNGPFGWYEKGYTQATTTLARAIAHSGAHTILGGGDTVAVIQDAGLERAFDFVSTGGGAMLAFLHEGTLPGIEVLKQ